MYLDSDPAIQQHTIWRAGIRKKCIKLSIGAELREQTACSLKIRVPLNTIDFKLIMERTSKIMPL